MLKFWSCNSVKPFRPLENSQQTFSLWNIYLITDQTHDSVSHTCRPLTDRSNRAPNPSLTLLHVNTLGLFCFLFFSFFLGGGGGRLLRSFPTQRNRSDCSNSWGGGGGGGGREGGRKKLQCNVAFSILPGSHCPAEDGERRRGGGGGGGRVVVTPWDSLFPPPTSLILFVTLPPLFLSLSTFSVCRLLFSPLLSSPVLSSHTPFSLTSLTHPALSLCIRGSCFSVSDWTCLIKMRR